MYTYNYLPGDRLLVMKGAVIGKAITHSATYMWDGLVAHISPSKGLVMESVEDFANGRDIQVRENGGVSMGLLRSRFEQFSDNPDYRLDNNNCEHLCNFLESGIVVSPQLQGGVAGFTGGLIAARALGVKNPWATVGLVLLTTYAGVRIGAPKAQQCDPYQFVSS